MTSQYFFQCKDYENFIKTATEKQGNTHNRFVKKGSILGIYIYYLLKCRLIMSKYETVNITQYIHVHMANEFYSHHDDVNSNSASSMIAFFCPNNC